MELSVMFMGTCIPGVEMGWRFGMPVGCSLENYSSWRICEFLLWKRWRDVYVCRIETIGGAVGSYGQRNTAWHIIIPDYR